MSDTSDDVKFQFDDLEQQGEADTLGVWAFLATEVMFFGGLFAAYTAYRWLNPDTFVAASHELNLFAGTLNTGVLLASSLAMALADHVISEGKFKSGQWLLSLTLALGLLFLCIKAWEYRQEFNHHLIPFLNETFDWEKPDARQARLFFNLYFLMTGLHAFHLMIGCALVGTTVMSVRHPERRVRSAARVGAVGLYWHFVDVVWVFLFPLLYLAR